MYVAVKDADTNCTAKFRILYGTVYNLPIVGARAFPIANDRIWNGLLAPDVTSAPSLTVFTQRLKPVLFRRSYYTRSSATAKSTARPSCL